MMDERFDLVSPELLFEETDFEKGFSRFLSFSFPVEFPEIIIAGKGERSRDSCGSVHSIKKCDKTGEKSVLHDWCGKPTCPICVNAWANKRALNVGKKLFALMQISPVYHWVISFDNAKPVESLMAEVKKYFPDSLSFFHPYRLKDAQNRGHSDPDFEWETGQWRFGRHVHVLSWINYLPTKEISEKTDREVVIHLIKKIDNEYDAALRLLCYEFSHIALERRETRWYPVFRAYGQFSNSKIHQFLYARNIPDFHVKCNCKECQKTPYHGARSDCQVSKVKKILVTPVHNGTETTFTDLNLYQPYIHSEKIYYPRKMLGTPALDRFFYMIGASRYMATDLSDRLEQKQLNGQVSDFEYKACKHSIYPNHEWIGN